MARLDALASNGDLDSYEFCREKLAEFDAAQLKPPPLLRGRDLLELGLRAGPHFSEILDAVGEAQLDGAVSTREEALEWARARFPMYLR